jgi:hypothetical protein
MLPKDKPAAPLKHNNLGKEVIKQWESEQRAPAPNPCGDISQAMWREWLANFDELAAKAEKKGHKGPLYFVVYPKDMYGIDNSTEFKIFARATRPTPMDNTFVFSSIKGSEGIKLEYCIPIAGSMHGILEIDKNNKGRFPSKWIYWIKQYLDGKLV